MLKNREIFPDERMLHLAYEQDYKHNATDLTYEEWRESYPTIPSLVATVIAIKETFNSGITISPVNEMIYRIILKRIAEDDFGKTVIEMIAMEENEK